VQGANVTIKQTEKGTITNAKGEFELPAVPAGGVLVFSFVGYAPQNFTVKDGSVMRIYMKVAQNELDKAVVQAYGMTTQRLTTADIGKVTAEEIEKDANMNPLLDLQGKVAGLDVNQTSGYASAPIKVELRGRASINPLFTSDPLYIIDGVPLTINEVKNDYYVNVYGQQPNLYLSGSPGFDQSGLSPAGGQSPLFSINPADIESIEVLKDADATAIYGSRGANGVILITTKKGKPGKTKLDLHAQEGTQRVDRFWNMMNTNQYLAMRRQALFNAGLAPDPINDYDINGTWDTTRYTNWQKVLYGGIGRTYDVQGSLSGGDAHTTFRIGAGYNRTTGITTISGADQRGSVSFNLTHHSLDQRLSIGFSNTFSYTQSNLINLPGAITLAPDAPSIYDSLGNLNWAGWGGVNKNTIAQNIYPFAALKQTYTGKTNFLNSNLVISCEVIRGLQASVSLGYNIGQGNQVSVNPIAAQNPLNHPLGSLNLGNNRNVNFIIEPHATYNVQLGRGRLSVLVGLSSSQNNTESLTANGSGFISDLLINSITNAASWSTSDLSEEYRYFGVFGRVSYNWENKYIVNINGRRDGSSRFGPGNQYGNFGSVGAAWIASEEKWLKNILPSFFSFIKLRGSYGITGSDAVPNYSYLSQYSSFNIAPYDSSSALVAKIDPNPNYRWQSNKKLEGAINFGFLKDRINAQVAWYRDRCGNQLVPFPTPLFTGFANVIENSPALVENVGWEFGIGATLIQTRKFSWSVNFNTAINQNKLVSYPNFAQSPYTATLKIGQPLNMSYVLHYIGVDQQTGQYSYLDKNHDGQIEYNPGQLRDDSYPLVLAPKFFGGVGMNFSYSRLNIGLSFNIKDQIGHNAFENLGNPPGWVNYNEPTYILGKQWQYPGDNAATFAKFTAISTQNFGNYTRSDGSFTDASFVRLSNLSISYALPSNYLRRAGIGACSFFFHTNNLFIITKYKGLDPETQNFGGLPPTKVMVGGISFNF
jgi:TonB-linked SusC/RagA family outer membrane protein